MAQSPANEAWHEPEFRRQRQFLIAQARLDEGPDPALREYRKHLLLAAGKPLPPDYVRWRYMRITRDMVAVAHLTWRGRPLVPNVVQSFRNAANEEARRNLAAQLGQHIKSLTKIESHAREPGCGTDESYRNLILCRGNSNAVGGQQLSLGLAASDYLVFDGSHRLCGVWLKFARADWPNSLAGFVGDSIDDDRPSDHGT
jgi:hypothetical protein